jgi:hypothetical protein
VIQRLKAEESRADYATEPETALYKALDKVNDELSEALPEELKYRLAVEIYKAEVFERCVVSLVESINSLIVSVEQLKEEP